MPISSKVRKAIEEQSWIRRMFELGLEMKREFGEDKVFDLSLGNPIFEPPASFVTELKRVVADETPGMHRYMPNGGYPSTRAALAEYLARRTGLGFLPSDVVMACGAGGGLNVVFKAILEPGDEVVIFAPYFPEYLSWIDNHGGVVKVIQTDELFQPDLNELLQALTPKTRAVLINSPNNPTGVVYSEHMLNLLGALIHEAEDRFGESIFLISDEPYAKLLYDEGSYPFVYKHHASAIVVTSFSKDLSLPGERIGYIAVNPACEEKSELTDAFIYCTRVLGFVNAPALMQRAIENVLDTTIDLAGYQHKRDYLHSSLTQMGYSLVKPQGAFYVFPRSPVPDDISFITELLRERILVAPGTGFGRPGHFRISYSVSDEVLAGAMEGFSRVARNHGLPG